MTKNRIFALLASATMMIATMLASASMSRAVELSADLNRAAADFGVVLMSDTYARYQYGDDVMEAAIIEGFQNVPPTEYGSGVDMAIVRYHSDELGVPDGYYKWRVTVEGPVERIGKYPATSSLLDDKGTVVFSQPNLIDVFSLTVTNAAADPGVLVSFNSQPVTSGPGAFTEVSVQGTVCCKNGMCGTCVGAGCPAN